MPAFCIGQIRIKDAVAWDEYRRRVGDTIRQYGGELLFRGQREQIFSGEMLQDKVVVLQFEDIEAAKRWHDSSEYQALIPTRDQGADVTLVLYNS
ncbi:MAG: DUF1330 domain-containing protein [Betaproteobacteria bacterium]